MSQFNADRAIQDLQELSYSRFLGTDGEKKAAEYIRKKSACHQLPLSLLFKWCPNY